MEVSRNRLPPWHHNIDMQTAIREQVDALLCLGVIEASHAPIWSQVRIVPKPSFDWLPVLVLWKFDPSQTLVIPETNRGHCLDWLISTDALSIHCTNLIEVVILSAIDDKERIPRILYRKISYGPIADKDRWNDKTISDRWIKLFSKQCPCC